MKNRKKNAGIPEAHKIAVRKFCLKTERVSTVEEWKVRIPGFFGVVWYGSPFPKTLLGNTDEHAPPIQWVEKHILLLLLLLRKEEVRAFVAVSADEREEAGKAQIRRQQKKLWASSYIQYSPYMVCLFCSEFLHFFCVAECLRYGPIHIISGPVF